MRFILEFMAPAYVFSPAQETQRAGIAHCISIGFKAEFRALTRSQLKIAQILYPAVDPKHFFVATQGSQVIAVLGFSSPAGYPVKVKFQDCRGIIGSGVASLAVPIMNMEFCRPRYLQDGQAHLGFFTILPEFRALGMAKPFMRYLIENTNYDSYTLDVTEGNEKVIPIYQSLGFELCGPMKQSLGEKILSKPHYFMRLKTLAGKETSGIK